MLIIRQDQMNVLSAYMRRSFKDRMVEQLTYKWPEKFEVLTESGARQLIQRGVELAAGHGIDRELDIATYIHWMMDYSPEFETTQEMAWTKATLDNQELAGSAKIKSIQRRLPRMVPAGETHSR